MKVVSSAIVDKYIGESARVIREMFGMSEESGCKCRPSTNTPTHTHTGYAREHEPCIIFMDEVDAIGGRRFSEGTSADREIQRTLMEVGYFVHVRISVTSLMFTVPSYKAPQPNGWFRQPRQDQDYHGNEPP